MANPAKLVAFNKIKMFQKSELWSKKTHLATLGATPGEGEGSCRATPGEGEGSCRASD